MATDKEVYEKLLTQQRTMRDIWVKNRALWPDPPDDEWPKEWHIARRYRCAKGHVEVGVTRLFYCRVCAREELGNTVVALTSPGDETGPVEFE